jgi:2-haloacid dehalogenase
MEEVRSGRRPFVLLDTLHRESLEIVFAGHDITASEAWLDELTLAWHRLDPWPDVPSGLARLAGRFTIGTLSNANTTLLEDLATRSFLPWDVLLGAETAGAYKPLPAAYLRSVEALRLDPQEVMLVAAHNGDLHAAAASGLGTAFIARPNEHGPNQTSDLQAEGDWSIVAADVASLADALGCP